MPHTVEHKSYLWEDIVSKYKIGTAKKINIKFERTSTARKL